MLLFIYIYIYINACVCVLYYLYICVCVCVLYVSIYIYIGAHPTLGIRAPIQPSTTQIWAMCCRKRATARREVPWGTALLMEITSCWASGTIPTPVTLMASATAASSRRSCAMRSGVRQRFDEEGNQKGEETRGTFNFTPSFRSFVQLWPSTIHWPTWPLKLAVFSPGSRGDWSRCDWARACWTAAALSWSVSSPNKSLVALTGFCITTSSSGHRRPSKTNKSRLPRFPATWGLSTFSASSFLRFLDFWLPSVSASLGFCPAKVTGRGPTAAGSTPVSSSSFTWTPSEISGNTFRDCCSAMFKHKPWAKRARETSGRDLEPWGNASELWEDVGWIATKLVVAFKILTHGVTWEHLTGNYVWKCVESNDAVRYSISLHRPNTDVCGEG